MKKPKWRKVKGEWRRGVLEVERHYGWSRGHYGWSRGDEWRAYGNEGYIGSYTTPEAAMKAADAWWERTRKRMEGK